MRTFAFGREREHLPIPGFCEVVIQALFEE